MTKLIDDKASFRPAGRYVFVTHNSYSGMKENKRTKLWIKKTQNNKHQKSRIKNIMVKN